METLQTVASTVEKSFLTPEWMITLGIGIAMFMGVVAILFEVLDIIFILTPTKKDDIWLAKVREKWDKLKPALEWFHIKTPLAKGLAKVLAGVKLVKAMVLNFKNQKNPKKPPPDDNVNSK